MVKIFLYVAILTVLNSCGVFSEAGKVLRNEKVKTTDEFLVKKREPLSQPPDFDKIPLPGSLKTSETNQDRNINKIFKIPKETTSKNKSSSLEKSILNEIKK